MSKGDISLVFGASIGKKPEKADIFFINHQQRVEKKGYKVKIIFNEDMKQRKERHEYYDNHKIHEIRYLHQSTFTETYIYKDSVLFLATQGAGLRMIDIKNPSQPVEINVFNDSSITCG